MNDLDMALESYDIDDEKSDSYAERLRERADDHREALATDPDAD